MKVYFTQVERILKSLPIGYYTGRRIDVVLNPEVETSFIDIISQNITVSFPQVEMAMSKIEDGSIIEQTIRNLLYHEVSHALLTNKNLICKGTRQREKDILNIMEDERIETALRHYYHNVDFKTNVERINNWDEMKDTPIRDAMDAFYRVVRFHVGKPEWVEMAERIVEDHIYDNAYKSNYWDFRWQAIDLYNTISSELGRMDEDEINNMMSNKPKTGMEGGSEMEMGASFGEDSDEDEESDSTIDIETEEESEDFKKMKDAFGKVLDNELDSMNANNEILPEVLSILRTFNKKNSGGSAIAAHSGVLNPRLGGRADYRIFERKAAEKGANKFNSVHINLFLDESGSYRPNVFKTNQIIYALAEAEKIDKNFTFDIVYCGMSERVVKNKQERLMSASGGNLLDDKIFSIYRKVQKPNAYNYNIILFDGDAFTDCPRTNHEDYYKNFGAFNHSNCAIISDYDNQYSANKYAPSAKRVYTRNYVNELQKNVIAALRLAFR